MILKPVQLLCNSLYRLTKPSPLPCIPFPTFIQKIRMFAGVRTKKFVNGPHPPDYWAYGRIRIKFAPGKEHYHPIMCTAHDRVIMNNPILNPVKG